MKDVPNNQSNGMRILNDSEFRTLSKACFESSFEDLYHAFCLGFSTGISIEELGTLSWDQIDLEQKTLVLNFPVVGDGPIRNLCAKADLLLEERKKEEAYSPEKNVFCNSRQKRDVKIYVKKLSDAWEKVLVEVKLPDLVWDDLFFSGYSYVDYGYWMKWQKIKLISAVCISWGLKPEEHPEIWRPLDYWPKARLDFFNLARLSGEKVGLETLTDHEEYDESDGFSVGGATDPEKPGKSYYVDRDLFFEWADNQLPFGLSKGLVEEWDLAKHGHKVPPEMWAKVQVLAQLLWAQQYNRMGRKHTGKLTPQQILESEELIKLAGLRVEDKKLMRNLRDRLAKYDTTPDDMRSGPSRPYKPTPNPLEE